MVFVLDNYDSFTYNLVQYVGELGAEVVVRRNDELTPAEVEALGPERILISPGPCTPEDAGISIALVRHFAQAGAGGGAEGADIGGVPGASGDWGGVWRLGGARGEADAWQDQRGGARWADDLCGDSVGDDLYAVPLADCGGGGTAGGAGGLGADSGLGAKGETGGRGRLWGCGIASCRLRVCSFIRRAC